MNTTAEGTITEIAEAMTGIDMTTAGTLTIIVKAMTNLDPMKMSSRQMDRDERKIRPSPLGEGYAVGFNVRT